MHMHVPLQKLTKLRRKSRLDPLLTVLPFNCLETFDNVIFGFIYEEDINLQEKNVKL